MAKSSHLFTFIVLVILFTSCHCIMDVLTNPDACVGELPSCELNLATPIGRRGLPGFKGDMGDKGLRGTDGLPGKDGRDGINGRDGAAGEPGPRGPVGPPGDRGSKGEKGNTSGDDGTAKSAAEMLKGPRGAPGLKGEQGSLGPRGEAGSPGIDATCGCKNEDASEESEPPSDSDGPEWGTRRNANVTCRNAPASMEFDESITYYLYLDIGVTCNPDGKKTCIQQYASEKSVNDFRGSKPFWLSEKGVSLKDIYDLEFDQLSWLQSESMGAEMTIKYHCYNSKPLGDASTDPMMLLSWNDVVIGPVSTPSSPFHYTTLSDDCSEAKKDEWSFTVIKLDSPFDDRLPIIDFFINDIRNETQEFRIEIVNLCFY